MESKKKEPFKNRRQKALRPVAVKLAEIQDKKTLPNKRIVLIFATVLLSVLFILGICLMLVHNMTNTLSDKLQGNRQEVQSEVESFTRTYRKADDKQKITLLEALNFKEINCGQDWLYQPLRDVVKRCSDRNRSLTHLNEAIRDTLATLRYDQATRAIIEKPSKETGGWDKQQITWENAVRQLQAVVPPSRMHASHQALVKQFQAVAKAWKVLREADAAKKLDTYKSAKKNVASQYEATRKLSEQYKKEYDQLQLGLYLSYREVIQ